MQSVIKTCGLCGRDFQGGEVFCPVDGTRLVRASELEMATPAEALVGAILDDRYRILRVIGEGGMGIVFEAEHVLIEKRVAVKVLRPEVSDRPDTLIRFQREAKSATRIGHRNIVDVSDFGKTSSGQSYFVMEMLHGEDLADILSREGALPPSRAVHIVHQCCEAVAAAHEKGIIHRDLKPENLVLIDREGRPDFLKIVDFGVAKMSDIETLGAPGRKLTKTGMIFGTPEYMSPEQADGKEPDHRVDIYAAGIILYELITGQVPFEGDNFMEILTKHAGEPLRPIHLANPRVQISAELEAIIYQALEKDPERRQGTMDEVVAALERTPEMPILPLTSMPSPAGMLSAPQLADARPIDPDSPTVDLEMPLTGDTRPELARPRATTSLKPREMSAAVELPRSRRGPLWAGAAAVLILLVAVFWRSAPDEVVVPSTGVPAAAAAPPTPQPASAPTVAASDEPHRAATVDAPAPAPEVTLVEVRVTSKPSGARLSGSGGDVVCARTPCSFTTPRGEPLVLTARRGKAVAVARIAPMKDRTLHMALRTKRPKNRRTSSGPGDLKVPDIFK